MHPSMNLTGIDGASKRLAMLLTVEGETAFISMKNRSFSLVV